MKCRLFLLKHVINPENIFRKNKQLLCQLVMSTGNKLIDSALQSHNYNLALKLVEKKIQQQPNASHNLACKCFILANAGLSFDSKITTEEALKETVDLVSKTPSDPATLALLNTTLQLLDYVPKEDVYEAAIRKYQTTGLAYEWFRQTVSENDLIGMQKAAMALSKGFKVDTDNGRMIKLWAAATMVIVTSCCKDNERLAKGKDKLLATLGLKIMETVEQGSKKALNAQELFVKCQLLLKKGDVEHSLTELKAFLAKESDLELLLIYFDELKKNEMWNELYESCINYLVNIGVDDWDTWKLAIMTARKIDKVGEISQIIATYKVTRNSQLAKIEVVDIEDIGAKKNALENYLSLYMHKLCCFLDLKTFFEKKILSKSDVLQSLESQLEKHDIQSVLKGERKAKENDLNVLVNYIKIKAFYSPEIFNEKEFFIQCCEYYNLTKSLENKLADFDYFAGFEFIILAIQCYLTLHKDSITTQTFLNLIVILENSLIKNKYEFHLQLWLAHMYLNTNMSLPLKRIFDSLKIKNVQIDTLAPYFINHLSSRTRNDDLISTGVKFYSNNVAMELPPMILSCFESCTFSKLKGFIEFKLRVDNSITRYELLAETIQHSRLNKKTSSVDSITSDYIPMLKCGYRTMILPGTAVDLKLHDNIDRTIIWQCGDTKEHQMVKKAIDTAFSQIYDVSYVQILILRELIIYDQNSRVWDDYKTRFLALISDTNNLASFSAIERSILMNFVWLLTESSTNELPQLSAAPTDPLSPAFNNYYLSIQDFEQILATVIKTSNASPYFGLKKNHAKLSQLHKKIKTLCRSIARDEIIESAKEKLKTYKNNAKQWFANDEFGKAFNIPVDVVNRCYKNFEQDVLKAVQEI